MLLALLASVTIAVQEPPVLTYRVRYDTAADSMVSIEIALPQPRRRRVDFGMPRAIPMGYGTQPYDRFVSGLDARDASGNALTVIDLDGPRWRIDADAAHSLASIRYQVNIARMEREILNGGDASRVRAGYLGLLGYSVFGFVDGLTDAPIQLDVQVPSSWRVLTTLVHGASAGSVRVNVRNFYALADAQIMAGPDLVLSNASSAVPFTLALYAEQPFAADSLAELAATALRATADYFGTIPVSHYTTSFELLRPLSSAHEYRFSMEHLESATYRFALGQVDMSDAGRSRTYYNLVHHTVHSWLPKQCAPAGYYPFTWDFAEPIEGIWFSEGWAQYIAADIAAGTGADAEQLRRARAAVRFDAAALDTLAPLGGRTTGALSAVASHQYSDDFRISQAVFGRGGLMAEAIDQRIRRATKGKRTFRDVARGVMSWCADSPTPVTADVLGRVVRNSTGVEVRDIIATWLSARGSSAPGRPRP